MDGELSVSVRRERGAVIAEVAGEVDLSTVAGLREHLSGLAVNGQPLIIELNRVTFIDSTGLGVLVSVARQAAAHSSTLHVVCSQPNTCRLLELTGMDRRIPLSATVDGALILLTASGDAPG
jgi:anti-sigma B factor antagonist